jgi:hypothetical protein
MVAEPDHAQDAGRASDLVDPFGEGEPGEQVIGKQSLGGPRKPVAFGASKANARQVHLDLLMTPERGGGEMFALGMGLNAEPRRAG